MMRVRPITHNDLDGIFALAIATGLGVSSLPPDKNWLKQRIAWSETSFAKKSLSMVSNEYYGFVMEESTTGMLVGTASIIACLGAGDSFFSLAVSKHNLHCVQHYEGFSELCGLFLLHDFRKLFYGKLLSRSRFLFYACFPKRFPKKVMAEIRGDLDKEGQSIFWQEVGRPIYNMTLKEADHHVIYGDPDFIKQYAHYYPIAIDALSQTAKSAIGAFYPNSAAAKKMLENEGFSYHGSLNIFDGGPALECAWDNLLSVKHCIFLEVSYNAWHSEENEQALVANNRLDFRCGLCHVVIDRDNGVVYLKEEEGKNIGVEAGDTVCVLVL